MRRLLIGRPALALLACLSAASTVLIVREGTRHTGAQTAALAALAQRPLTVTAAAAPATTSTAATRTAPTTHIHSSSSGGGSGTASGSASSAASGSPATSIPATPSPAPTATQAASTTTTTHHTTPAPDAGLPDVGHVFLITLSTPSYRAAFGASSKAPYLRRLAHRGTVLSGYESLGHGELADELAMVSGQAPNSATSAGCPTYREFPSSATANAAGIVAGTGCVYPTSAISLGDQVTADGKSWAAYVADQGSEACQHPDSGAETALALPQAQAGYDLDHNPFIFFHSLLDAGGCIENDLNLPKFTGALRSASRTPRFTYVGADACADADPVTASPLSSGDTSTTTTATSTTGTTTTGTSTEAASTSTATTVPDTSSTTETASGTTTTPATAAATWGCASGDPSGVAAENTFLATWVPRILRSAAYRSDGVLVIAFTGTADMGHPTRTGALVLSRHTPSDHRIGATYSPYSLLRSIEDMLNDKPLADAATATAFAEPVLSR